MRRISGIFAEKYRGTCRRDSGNSGNFFAASREKRTPRVSLFVFYSIKEKIDFSRRENKCGDKEEEGREGKDGGRRGRQEGKGNDKKERRQGRQESRDNENAKVTTRKKVGAGKSRAAGRQKGFKEKIGEESAFGGAEKRKKRREKTGVRRKKGKGGKTGILRKARAAGG